MNRSHTKKWCFFKTPLLLLSALLLFGLAQTATAALQAHGPISNNNGFPIWYEDQNGLRLDLCLDQNGFCLTEEPNPGAPISFPDNFGPEMFWWSAGAALDDPVNTGLNAELVLALEAVAGEPNPVDGGQVAFARIRIRVDVPQPGEYTVTHPFGERTFTVPPAPDGEVFDGGRAINVTQDIGNFLVPGRDGDFTIALGDAQPPGTVNADGASIGPFLTAVGGNVTSPDGLVYLANPGVPTQVLGGPNGNVFTVSGPTGVATTDLFSLMGKVSGCTQLNTDNPPIAFADLTTTTLGQPVTIPALANDTDTIIELDEAGGETAVPGQPLVGTANIVTPPAAAIGTAVVNADNTITFTPAADFSGIATFQYAAADLCGVPSNTATVTVAVEDLQFNQSDLRVRTGKWSINGSSNFNDLVVPFDDVVETPLDGLVTINFTAYITNLFGAQEVPPVTSAASGEFAAIFESAAVTPAEFDYNLTVNVPVGTEITQAHIHVGDTGINGPVIFFLCTNLDNARVGTVVPPCENIEGVISVSGTLTVNELLPRPEQGINTFAEAVAAIQTGGTYTNAHSVANPPGEVRGQIGRNVISLRVGTDGPAIGTAEIQADASWDIDGKLNLSPAAVPTIEVKSGLGNSVIRDLRLR